MADDLAGLFAHGGDLWVKIFIYSLSSEQTLLELLLQALGEVHFKGGVTVKGHEEENTQVHIWQSNKASFKHY